MRTAARCRITFPVPYSDGQVPCVHPDGRGHDGDHIADPSHEKVEEALLYQRVIKRNLLRHEVLSR
jgi:hypothetical protein